MIASLSTELTTMTWHAIWKYLRTAPTLPAVRMRLNEILHKFPNSKKYIDFLWRNVSTWAICAFTWELDYGFQASSMQEGMTWLLITLYSTLTTLMAAIQRQIVSYITIAAIIRLKFHKHRLNMVFNVTLNMSGIHSTLKLNLRKAFIPLHKTLDFFRESLIRRKLNVDRKHSITTLRTELESAAAAGFSKFSKLLTVSLTDEGIKLALDQFQKGLRYKVAKLTDASDIHAQLDISELRRGPSATRFRCLVTDSLSSLESQPKFISGDYYKITSRAVNGSTDVVFISCTGNIACTSPSYARWGMPSKHIYAVFYDGSMCMNMKQHFHPVYHLQFMNNIADSLVSDFTATSDIPNKSVIFTDKSTRWNWGQDESHAAWELVGLGGAAYSSAAHPTVKSISTAPESISERTKKAFNYCAPFINKYEEERDIFYLYYEGLLRRCEHCFIILSYS